MINKRRQKTRQQVYLKKSLKSQLYSRGKCRLFKIWLSKFCLRIKNPRLSTLMGSKKLRIIRFSSQIRRIQTHLKASYFHSTTETRQRTNERPILNEKGCQSKWWRPSSLTTSQLWSLGRSKTHKLPTSTWVCRRGQFLILRSLLGERIRAQTCKPGLWRHRIYPNWSQRILIWTQLRQQWTINLNIRSLMIWGEPRRRLRLEILQGRSESKIPFIWRKIGMNKDKGSRKFSLLYRQEGINSTLNTPIQSL